MRSAKQQSYDYKSLLAKLFLMAGDIQSVAQLCKGGNVYGWSGGSPEALLFCAVLWCAGGGEEKCRLLNEMFGTYCRESVFFGAYPMNDEEPATSVLEEITRGLNGVGPAAADLEKHIQTAMRNGEKRVDFIVSNKHRKAYGRAAAVLGAMAEVLVCRGEKQLARSLIHTYYFEKFNRFPAFRREVREAVANSPLLTGMGV